MTDVAEQDIALVKVGAPAKVTFRAFPDLAARMSASPLAKTAFTFNLYD
jgi:hypothetical protein